MIVRRTNIRPVLPNGTRAFVGTASPPPPKAIIDRLFQLLEAAALAGEVCPTNADLCDRLDLPSLSTPVGLMKRLEADGKIKVQRWQSSRVVKIVATGRETAHVGKPTPHWRLAR